MIYKFKSDVTGNLIMMESDGDRLLRILGKEPAAQGIIELATLPAAIKALKAAIAQEETQPRQVEDEDAFDGPVRPSRDNVSLRQRAWPLVEMMQRARAEAVIIVWGV